ncbi:GNAT family N-acetyltransferase [Sphingobium sp. YR768]|uniref:GNAT family N-acetyltransferase n=1 Tax=Sphingobium sp. YR768 TaxID=1884365 RepID=UPI0008AFEA41|nr:GNAT family N-acetyltransferase [Sphingobium sp. YR768]SER93235.1 Protein N-acetyltransferase, RimJ/RimL family [Sphingobium sp. YR768]
MAEFRLETDRLILREWRAGDIDPFMLALDTPDVMRWLGGSQPRSHYADMQQAMARMQAETGHCFWIIESRADGAILGFCGPRRGRHPATPIYGEVELGWRLSASHWGQGLAREAAQAAIDWCWANLPDRRVIAYTVPGNSASWGLMQRLGMARQAAMDFDHPYFAPGHPLCRHIVYALDRPD